MTDLGYGITCTLRANRISNCPIPSEKDMKRMPRGHCESFVSDNEECSIVAWKDAKRVLLGSNFVDEDPNVMLKRWCKHQKVYVEVQAPQIVDCYDKHMGGVDTLDMMAALHPIPFRSKKWYTRIIWRIFDLVVINSWILMKYISDFRADTTTTANSLTSPLSSTTNTLHLHLRSSDEENDNEIHVSRKRKREYKLAVVKELRFDGLNYLPKFIQTKNASRCKNEECEQKHVVRTILGINPKAIHEELATALGPKAPSYPTVAEWAKRFREGREDVNDDPRSDRPVSVLTDENVEVVRQVINNDPHSTYDDIIAETFLSRGTIEQIIHNYLKMKKVTSRWIPHQLNDEQKQERVRLCCENLAKFRDDSWQIHHKSTNKTWIGDGESPRTIVRRREVERKNLFSIFFKSNGPVLIHAVDNDETTLYRQATGSTTCIDHDYYIENCLKPVVKEIRKQRKSNGTKGIKLLHDNASPHRHSDVINYLTEEGINIIPHPPYSPDLAPCGYWLNDYIKRNLTDQPDEKSLARAVSKLIKNIPEEEFKKKLLTNY
ncbi:unnamed protein product [Rotaria magnacalcarata]